MQERKGFWHEPDGRPTTEAIALEDWARAAHDVLEETASTYHGVVREADLAERCRPTGIRTTRPPRRWLPKLLQPLAHLHHRDGYPPLTALVVDGHGWVGERYDDVLRAIEELPITDAARPRAARRPRPAGVLPVGRLGARGRRRARRGAAPSTRSRAPALDHGRRHPGAQAPRVPRASPRSPRPKRVAASDRPVTVCPTCFMAIPATGLCDNCD